MPFVFISSRVLTFFLGIILLIGAVISLHAAEINDPMLGISSADARTGNITYNDIPVMIVSLTNWLLGISGTISIMVIIYGALKLQFGSGVFGSANTGNGKKAILGGITGFVISAFAWLIVSAIITLLTRSS